MCRIKKAPAMLLGEHGCNFSSAELELNGANYIEGIPTAFSAALDHFRDANAS